MGRTVYLPIHLLTWMVDLYGKCRYINMYQSHGCVMGLESCVLFLWLLGWFSLQLVLTYAPIFGTISMLNPPTKKQQLPAQSFYRHKIIPQKTSRLPCWGSSWVLVSTMVSTAQKGWPKVVRNPWVSSDVSMISQSHVAMIFFGRKYLTRIVEGGFFCEKEE